MRNMKNFLFPCLCIVFPFLLHAQTSFTPEELIEQGMDAHDKGYYETAILHYEEAYRLDSMGSTAEIALYEMAFAYSEIRNYDRSLSLISRVLQLNPNSLSSLILQANIYDITGNEAAAFETFKIARSLCTDSVSPHLVTSLYFNLGVTYYNMQKVDSACVCFAKALDHKPFHPSSNYYLALCMMHRNALIEANFCFYRFLLASPCQTNLPNNKKFAFLKANFTTGITENNPDKKNSKKKKITLTVSNEKDLRRLILVSSYYDQKQYSDEREELYGLTKKFFAQGSEFVDTTNVWFQDGFILPFKLLSDSEHFDALFNYMTACMYEISAQWCNDNEDKLNTAIEWLNQQF